MKLTALAIIAFGSFALITAGSAMASDRSTGLTHADLSHRNADRQQTYQTARNLGLSHSQTDRLTRTLQHQARDDQQAHRSATGGVQAYSAVTPRYGFSRSTQGVRAQRYRTHSARRNGYSNQGFGTAVPSHRNRGWNYGYSRSAYNDHGLNISTPRFSLSLGH